MHECPECERPCFCSGDLDDALVMTPEWAMRNCTHCDDTCPTCHQADCVCEDDDEDREYEWQDFPDEADDAHA